MAKKYWIGGDAGGGGQEGDFNNPNNWDPVGVPIAGDELFFTQGNNSVDGADVSGADYANFYVGPEFGGNIGDSTTPLTISLSSGAGERISIEGKPTISNQEIWLEYSSANNTDLFCGSFGSVKTEQMDQYGIHIKETSTGAIANTQNNASPLSLDGTGGTFTSVLNSGIGRLIQADGPTILNFTQDGAGSYSELNKTPTTSLSVRGGECNQFSSDLAAVVNVNGGGRLNWNGGASISSRLVVNRGQFSMANATRQPTIEAIEISGTAVDSILDLRTSFGVILGAGGIKLSGTPKLQFPEGSLLGLTV